MFWVAFKKFLQIGPVKRAQHRAAGSLQLWRGHTEHSRPRGSPRAPLPAPPSAVPVLRGGGFCARVTVSTLHPSLCHLLDHRNASNKLKILCSVVSIQTRGVLRNPQQHAQRWERTREPLCRVQGLLGPRAAGEASSGTGRALPWSEMEEPAVGAGSLLGPQSSQLARTRSPAQAPAQHRLGFAFPPTWLDRFCRHQVKKIFPEL